MVLTVDKLINDDRFCGENVFQFLLYLPFGLILMAFRTVLALILWVASIILPNKSAVRQVLSTLACWTFGVYVKVKGSRDQRCSVLVANYVSCLDSLAAAHVLGTISYRLTGGFTTLLLSDYALMIILVCMGVSDNFRWPILGPLVLKLRKWKVPPFFASTLGIKNVAQFARKQHFAESPSKPVLLQPEGGPTNGKGLLRFTDWPFQIGNKVQPVAITVERMFTNVTVHRPSDSRSAFPWSDALWFLWTPATVFTVRVLPSMDRSEDSDAVFSDRLRQAIADALEVQVTEYKWEELNRGPGAPRREPPPELMRLARQVREVLPRVPIRDIVRDLSTTRSVDVTITNFLEGVTPYVAEPEPVAEPTPSTSPKYVTPTPTGTFPRSARERQLSFQERKAQMIAEARQRYIEKHGLQVIDC